ncbi:3-deoxy-manno-octulosonate cytidylyltransferase [Ignavibacteria bacterium]|nr:3-deoxy-manno-octulosonate cytidylyltransferase [Bacteroidota bacterium]MCZ2133316.1 3-deoxy-manno-octulosonate cytidylyltransferase [Bacteroidota bacterium]
MNNTRIIGAIPARYGASRFPGKPLADIAGKTMIHRVVEAAMYANSLSQIIVATDDERIAQEAEKAGAVAIMPEGDFPSGTDRIFAALQTANISADIIVNIQGDEPLLKSSLIDDLARAAVESGADVTTPVARVRSTEELENPAVVKVAIAKNGRALYFSRSVIPHIRGAMPKDCIDSGLYFKHIGLYAYRRKALERFASLPPSPLELAESLEQLRLLEYGASYYCVECETTLYAVDTPADAEIVRKILSEQQKTK